MESNMKEERERQGRLQVIPEIHFLPCLPQEQSIFHYMQYNHWLESNRRRLCLENISGMYNMSCMQLLALANTAATSSSLVLNHQQDSQMSVYNPKIESNPWSFSSETPIGINADIGIETTIENPPQCNVSTPQKFCYDLNLTPEEVIMSTSWGLTESDSPPIALETPKKDQPHDEMKKSLPETGEKGRKRAREEEKLELKTPKQIQKRKKIRPKVVREGETKRSSSKPAVKKAPTTPAATEVVEANCSVRPKRSTRRTLRFDFDFDFEEEEEYCRLGFTSDGYISEELEPNPTMRIFDNIPKRKRRQNRTSEEDPEKTVNAMSWLQFPNIPRKRRTDGNDYETVKPTCSTVCLFNTEQEGELPSDYHISENNYTKFGRKRSTRVTRPRNFRSLKSFIPMRHERKRYMTPRQRPHQLVAIVSKMQQDVSRKKRSNRDSIASQLNAKVLHLQWRRRHNPTGSIPSPDEILERRFLVDEITKLLKELDINGESLCLPLNKETALILHQNAMQKQKEHGAMVLYDNGKKHQPKVNLDDETTRVWNLLMVSIDSEGVDGLDEDKTKWWEDERIVFRERANSFIARMRLVQGDRRFSPWKGSVVDSVVGVFLTQNVADHSSSSAFIDIAAEFPIKSSSERGLCYEEWGSSLTFESVLSSPDAAGNAVTTSVIRNPARVIIQEIDDDDEEEETDAVCSQETAISSTNQPEPKLLDSSVTNGFDGSEEKEIVKCDEEEKTVVRKKPTPSRKKGGGRRRTAKAKPKFDWDCLRREAESGGQERKRDESNMDTVDWDALRCSDVEKIAEIIRKRGMNNMLSKRIKAFLNRVVKDHGSINLEWLRDVPPDKAKEYLLSIDGLGLKSVECVRLLSLHQVAFPVDTNVGRIAVRLGWVPLQPLPDELQMHLLELYPVLESVQKYLWPRLCKLDQKTLYELHYHMITFGKVFCTKVKPNCKACPLKAECRHYASARASAQLALPEPEDKTIVISHENKHNLKPIVVNFRPSLLLTKETEKYQHCEPIIEEPTSPEPECVVHDIEDYPWDNDTKTSIIVESGGPSSEDPWESKDVIPTIMLRKEANTSKEMVVLSSQASSIPTHKLKTMEKLRTEHHVYELPDSHPILEGFEKRELEDKFPYLLAIWTPGETANSIQPPERRCIFEESNTLCNEKTCFSCNSTREEMSRIVRGTILIPCRTAMRGGFPLNGTYFQTNEVFADHGSSVNPINVPRGWIWNLPRRIAYFGSSVSAIFGGLSVEAIKYGFWRGYVCVRGFDRGSRTSQTLVKRLHCSPGKQKEEGGSDE